MRILLLTAGERVSDSGLFRSQVIDLAREYSRLGHSVQIVSFLPYINTDLLRLSFRYERFLDNIRSQCLNESIHLEIIRLPISSHFQFIGKYLAYQFWRNPLISRILFSIVANFKPNTIHCRALIAASLATKLPLSLREKTLVNFDLRGNAVSESILLYAPNKECRSRISRLQQKAIYDADTITCVSEILAQQCGLVSSSRLHITNIASALMGYGKDNTSDAWPSYETKFKFVFIGSFGKTWYPAEEFIRVAKSILMYNPTSTFIFLAPSSSHALIQDLCIAKSIPIETISSFTNPEEAREYTLDCTYGILPYRRPLRNEPLHASLAATVMSTKLSDYICLGLIPVVPSWCVSAADFVSNNQIGFTYNENYDFSVISETTDLNLWDMKSRLQLVSPSFSVEIIAKKQLEFFLDKSKAKQSMHRHQC